MTKKNQDLLECSLYTFAGMITTYLLESFVLWDSNVAEWNEWGRLFPILGGMLFLIVAINTIEPEKKKDE